MIRPITVICWILALGAGLYLYRAKHEVELMDKHIEQIARETSDIRTESRRLLDDWIRLGEPEQLHKYSDEYLGLKTIAPTQFARLSDLTTRLPEPRADPPAETEAVAQSSTLPEQPAQAEAASTDSTDEADAGDLPVPPIPPANPLLTTVSLPGVTVVPLQAKPVTPRVAAAPLDEKPRPAAETHVADEPRAVTPKAAPVAVAEPRPIVPRPVIGQVQPQPVVPRPVIGQVPPQPVPREHELPPLQAQMAPAQSPPRETQARGSPPIQQRDLGLPPLQARGASPQPFGRAIPWSNETHVADTGANDPRRDARPMPPQFGDPRGPQMTRQAPMSPPSGPPAAGSLLGMPRGPVPLPLPAPTPVSAMWNGPSGPGR